MPNTIVLPLLFDEAGKGKTVSQSIRSNLRNFLRKKSNLRNSTNLSHDFLNTAQIHLGDLSMKHKDSRQPDVLEYLGIIRDILISSKNVIIAENFETYNSELLNSVSIQQYVRRRTGQNEQEMISPVTTLREKLIQRKAKKSKRIDVWIECAAYSWDMEDSERDSGFPALMLQLAFIVSQNPQFARSSQIRAILMVQLNCEERSKEVFLRCCKVLRLKVDYVLCVPDVHGRFKWEDFRLNDEKLDSGGVEAGKEPEQDVHPADTAAIALGRRLNNLLCNHSEDTYITFFALSEIPPMYNNLPDVSRRLGHSWLLYLVNLVNGIPCPIAFVKTGEIDPVISTAM